MVQVPMAGIPTSAGGAVASATQRPVQSLAGGNGIVNVNTVPTPMPLPTPSPAPVTTRMAGSPQVVTVPLSQLQGPLRPLAAAAPSPSPSLSGVPPPLAASPAPSATGGSANAGGPDRPPKTESANSSGSQGGSTTATSKQQQQERTRQERQEKLERERLEREKERERERLQQELDHKANDKHIFNKEKLTELVKAIDPMQQLDEEVESVLFQLADDFIENVVNSSCLLAKHRKSQILEAKDVSLVLERQHNLYIPGFGGDDLHTYKKTTTSEAHKQRLALIRKTLKKF